LEELLSRKISVDGVEYYKVSTFAKLTKRSEQSVRLLVNSGNRLRKLKHIKIARSLLIPATELTDYPFCLVGISRRIVRFDAKGVEYIESLDNYTKKQKKK